jgi:SAM-dependent methyltransferase
MSAGHVLDVATGDGTFIGFLVRALAAYERFAGIDVSARGLGRARVTSRRQTVELLTMQAGSLGFASEAFDTVCVAGSLHHLEDPPGVLAEMKRVLKPGGHLLLQEMVSDGDQPEAQINEVLVHSWLAEIDTLLGRCHRQPYTSHAVQAMVQAAGFRAPESILSAWPTKCAICKYTDHCAQPLRPAKVNGGLRVIRAGLKQIKDHPAYPEYQARAKILRKRVRKHGYREAPVVFVIASRDMSQGGIS